MYQALELALTYIAIPSVTDSLQHESLRVFSYPSLILTKRLYVDTGIGGAFLDPSEIVQFFK